MQVITEGEKPQEVKHKTQENTGIQYKHNSGMSIEDLMQFSGRNYVHKKAILFIPKTESVRAFFKQCHTEDNK